MTPVIAATALRMAWRHDYRHAYRTHRAPRQPLPLIAEGEQPQIGGAWT